MRGTRVAIIVLLLLFSLSFAQRTEAETYEPAKRCRACHRSIHDAWARSAHARSFSGATFRKSLTRQIVGMDGEGALCFSCHAPAAMMPEAPRKAKRAVRDGVTCDFCHTTVSARGEGPYPRFSNIPGAKRGAVENAMSPHHDSTFSPLLLDSRFCSGCHQFRNRHGVDVLSTYAEWGEAGFENSGTHCQHCHLPKLYREVHLMRKKLGSDRPADHSFRGGHDPEKLRAAISMMGYLFVASMRAYVEIELENEHAGHMLPTGIPSHRIVLGVRLRDVEGKELGIRQLSFERVLGDKKGNRLSLPEEFFSRAGTVLRDDRIAPGKKRKLSTVFPLVSVHEMLSAELILSYELPPQEPSGGARKIPFYTVTVPYHRWDVPWEWIAVVLLLFTAGLAAYMLVHATKSRP